MVPAERPTSLPSLGQLGGIANLAGFDLGGGGSDEYLAVLRSRELIAEFIEEHGLVPVLFKAEWDDTQRTWRDSDPESQPDIRLAVEYFDRKVRTVSNDQSAGIVTVGIQWKDAALAADWANELAALANKRLRARALEEAERNVEYLQQQVEGANVVSLRQAAGRVLESEMQKLMMARGTDEFAFKIVDRAVAPRKRFRPQRTLLILMSAFSGGVLAVGFLLMRRSLLAGVRHITSAN